MSQIQTFTESNSNDNIQPETKPIIIGTDCWPALIIEYNFIEASEKPALQLVLGFDYQLYTKLDAKLRIRKQIQDLAVYQQLKTQFLLKNNDEKAAPLLSYFVDCSLDPANKLLLSADDVSALKAFVVKIITKLELSINAAESAEEPQVTLAFPVQLTNQNNVFRLDINFNISNLNQDQSKPYGNASGVVLPVGADCRVLPSLIDSFEQLFENEKNAFKIAKDGENEFELWVIRMALTDEAKGISYSAAAIPVNPLPLSTELSDVQSRILPYKDGKLNLNDGKDTIFSSIDINLWMSDLLMSFDKISDSLTDNVKAKLKADGHEAVIEKLTAAKNKLSDSLANRYKSTYYGGDCNKAALLTNVKDRLQHKLNAFNTTNFLQYTIDAKPQESDYKYFITGNATLVKDVSGVIASEIALPGVFPALNFTDSLATSRNILPLDMEFTATHLVLNGADHSKKSLKIQKNPGKVGVFVNVPILNLSYPELPSAAGFRTEKSATLAGSNLKDARKATLQFKMKADLLAQDEAAFKLLLNTEPQPPATTPTTTSDSLSAALAQFTSTKTALLADLESYHNQEPKDQNEAGFVTFITALETFASLAANVAEAMASEGVNETAKITPIDKGDFVIGIRTAKPVGDNRLVVELTNPINDRSIMFSIDGFETVIFAEDNRITDNTKISYIFKNGDDTLTIDDGKALELNIEVGGLDVLQIESIVIQNKLIRNNKPLPKPVDDAFIFSTPFNVVATLQPANVWAETSFDLSSLTTDAGTQGAEAYLSSLFKSLIQGTGNLALNIVAEISCKTLLNGDLSNPLWATNPVLLMQDTTFDAPIAEPLAGEIADKLKTYQGNSGVDAAMSRFVFDIKIKSAASNRSLLTFEELYLPVNKL